MMELVLASASPRRLELMNMLGFEDLTVLPAVGEENVDLSNESFICVIAVRTEDKDNEIYKRIADVFCSDVTGKAAAPKPFGKHPFGLYRRRSAGKRRPGSPQRGEPGDLP